MAEVPKQLTPFKKGTTGNPNGRPKGALSMTKLMREYLETKDPKTGKYVKDIVNEAFVKRAVAKSDTLMKELMDRVDGKVVDNVNLSGDIQFVLNDSLTKRDEISPDTE